jgi:NADH dehydrogenase [ubiquinone] 1 alpha subcomplex assembly factor 7
MRDALRAARVVPEFARAARLHLIERSPVLRAAQARALPAASAQWHDDASTLPPGPLLLIANEFLDALPIRQYLRGPLTPSLSPEGRGGLRDLGGWHERRVGLAEGGLAFVLDPAPAAMGNLPPGLADAAPGSICETRPAASALARLVATRLAAEGGAALFIDYGHGDSACGDTLQAVRRHRAHPVLAEPGAADLTAHVDFAAFAAAASEAGARVWGPVDQGAFLGALGIAARTEALMANATPEAAALLGSATLRLVDPAHMGRLFKVVALTHPAAPAPAGFA